MRHLLLNAFRPFYFRGKGRLCEEVCPRSGEVRAQVFGSNLILDRRDLIQRQIYCGTFEPFETRLVASYLRPGMTLVDVGANVGYFTLLGAQRVGPAGRVIAYEPSPYAYDRLSRAVRENGLAHVTAINAGLSDVPGRLPIYWDKNSVNHTPTMVPHDNPNLQCVDVAVKTLDSEAESLALGQIDLIKIDVEGYEPHVLEGARQLLAQRRVRAVLCEFNEHWLGRRRQRICRSGRYSRIGGVRRVDRKYKQPARVTVCID